MILLDTHALIWWLAEPTKLSAAAKKAINFAAKRRGVSISAVSLLEVRRLIERGRLELGIDPEQWFSALRSLPELDIEPVSAKIAWAAGGFGPLFPGDPADRIIAATCRELAAQLVTADAKLHAAGVVKAIW